MWHSCYIFIGGCSCGDGFNVGGCEIHINSCSDKMYHRQNITCDRLYEQNKSTGRKNKCIVDQKDPSNCLAVNDECPLGPAPYYMAVDDMGVTKISSWYDESDYKCYHFSGTLPDNIVTIHPILNPGSKKIGMLYIKSNTLRSLPENFLINVKNNTFTTIRIDLTSGGVGGSFFDNIIINTAPETNTLALQLYTNDHINVLNGLTIKPNTSYISFGPNIIPKDYCSSISTVHGRGNPAFYLLSTIQKSKNCPKIGYKSS